MSIRIKKGIGNGGGGGGGNGGGGGSPSFPTVVTDSGSSLPVDLTGYNVGDTFLNTSDDKLYTIKEKGGYKQNTGNYSSGVSVDLETGIASGFTGSNYIARTMPNNSKEWNGTGVSYKFHFKATSFSGLNNDKFQVIFRSQSSYQSNNYSTAVAIQNKQMYLILAYTYSSSQKTGTKLFDYEIIENTEYFFRITKNGTTAFVELFVGGYDGTLVASGTIETSNNIASSGSRQTSIRYGMNQEWGDSNVENFINGEVYLTDSEGELVVPDTDLEWNSGESLINEKEYIDTTNNILYAYYNDSLITIGDLKNYRQKSEKIINNLSQPSISIRANKNYVFTSSSISSINFSGCETSFEETTIEFTTGSTAPTLTDNSGITWVDGSAPTLNANKSYLIVIFNKLGFVKEY